MVLIAQAYGYVVQFRLYQGARKRKEIASSTKWGLGENVVLRLIECLTAAFRFDIFMDNYFTSFCLLTYIGFNSIRATDKKQCKFDCGWLERQQCGLHVFF